MSYKELNQVKKFRLRAHVPVFRKKKESYGFRSGAAAAADFLFYRFVQSFPVQMDMDGTGEK